MSLCPRCSAELGSAANCPQCGLATSSGSNRPAAAIDGWTMLGLLLVFPGLTCFFTAWPTYRTGGHGRVTSAIDWNGSPNRFLLAVGVASLLGFAVTLLSLARRRR